MICNGFRGMRGGTFASQRRFPTDGTAGHISSYRCLRNLWNKTGTLGVGLLYVDNRGSRGDCGTGERIGSVQSDPKEFRFLIRDAKATELKPIWRSAGPIQRLMPVIDESGERRWREA